MPSLIVRLPNHLGDTCMALPALDLLAARTPIVCAGPPWAADLLQARGWPHIGLADARGARVAALRAWRLRHAADRQGLLLTNSFSSALDFRLAGLRPAGYARDGRRLLLQPAYAVPPGWAGAMHTIDYYVHLALAWLGAARAPGPSIPATPRLALLPAARERAQAALQRAGVPLAGARPPVLLCPIARGRHRGQDKCWDGFGRLGRALRERGEHVVVCPGPGETEAARAAVPDALLLEPLDLAAFAAVLAASRLVVANDSGPAHLAAAVGATLLVVYGVTDPAKTGARGAHVHGAGGSRGWPDYAAVAALAGILLAGSSDAAT
jgi:heptosyltransferase-2